MTLQANHALGRSVTVTAGDVELFSYVYRPDTPVLESPKPYLHPIRTVGGALVSLFRPHDHVWHKGIAWSLPHVGEHNFWGGPTYVHGKSYVQVENNGSATHREMTTLTAEDKRVEIGHTLDWTSQAGAPVIEEQRSLAATVLDEATWALVFDTTMTNVSGGTLHFGSPTTKGRENAGYGGLFWRGPRSFTGGIIQSPAGAGGDELRGTRAEWFGFRGRHDETGEHSTIVMVDDAANPQHPPQWFARSEDFACLCPAPFFSEEVPLPDGETLRFRYAVVIADGDRGEDGTALLAKQGRAALA
ncbi:methane monooxygenase PmoA-like [Nonomuraea polychroma]|uniref:Methane monooxygenase PmoA-like n=1 Tax=Nonomuraea polychroma TaxID=46176 RepID=A0A438LYH9_9ACTN|nr:PmoA family protein [Nonomuraea polychroma]RVX38521.1 methane monooxygenase PmoA-like [Nonomuraea polychroma]